MREWIVVVVLYAMGMGLFGLLGGLAAAAQGIRRWGETSSNVRAREASVSG